MGVFLDSVNERARAAVALAHRVALYLNNGDRRAIIVEAGDDQFFYSALLRRKTHRRQVGFFTASGKSNLTLALSLLTDLKKLDRSFGIIDRDFDYDLGQRLHQGHCLVLDVYSYENYLMTSETLVEVGKAAFGLEGGAAETLRWEDTVSSFLGTAALALRLEHAQALWCRRNNKICHLNNFDPISAVVVNSDGSVVRTTNTNVEFLTQTGADLADLTDVVAESLCNEITDRGIMKVARGHFFDANVFSDDQYI